MAKKPRSQRRKKGGQHDVDRDDEVEVEVDILSEDHTVADTIVTFDADFENDFGEGNEDDGADFDLDDLLSTGGNSHKSSSSRNAERHVRLVEALTTASEIPSEKRSARREGSLRRIFRALTQYATGSSLETVEKYREDLVIASCRTGLRVGGPSEQYASCRVLEALGVVLGANQDEHFEQVEPYLRRVVMSTHKAGLVRVAALRALVSTSFICSTDEVMTDKVLDLCEQVSQKQYRNHDVPSTLRASALDCWALLTTTLQDVYISGQSDFHNGRGLVLLELLQECLESSSMELRSAAGECVALIHESRWNITEVNEDDGANVTERQYTRGSWEGTEWYDRIAEIQQRMAELSTLSTKNLSKRAKKQQRATFREYLTTLLDDESPEETIHFRGGSWTLTSWREIVQVNFLRQSLQGGFQLQLLTNSTLQTIFGLDSVTLGTVQGLSQVEKRLIMSKGSEAAKLAHMDMTKKRRVRNNVKNHFLIVDGEDL